MIIVYLMKNFLQSLLSTLARRSDRLGVVLKECSRWIQVKELRPVFVAAGEQQRHSERSTLKTKQTTTYWWRNTNYYRCATIAEASWSSSPKASARLLTDCVTDSTVIFSSYVNQWFYKITDFKCAMMFKHTISGTV